MLVSALPQAKRGAAAWIKYPKKDMVVTFSYCPSIPLHLKICDFGLSREYNPNDCLQERTDYVVTRWYRAPELLLMVCVPICLVHTMRFWNVHEHELELQSGRHMSACVPWNRANMHFTPYA